MDVVNFINQYWPVLTSLILGIAWCVGIQHTQRTHTRDIKALFELHNGKDRRGE